MSLFGTGRREGVAAVLALVALALVVHALGAGTGLADGYEGDQTLAAGMATAHGLLAAGEQPLWDPVGAGAPLWTRGAELLYPPWWLLGRGHDDFWLPALAAMHAALACALAFRFLRAQGRSRYASFVAGAAYGLGGHVGALSGNLAEVAALAWAPLPIEVFLQVARGRWRLFAPLLGPALALPFYTGGTVTAACTTGVVAFWLLRRALHEPARRPLLNRTAAGSTALLLLLTAPLWLCQADAPGSTPPLPPLPDVGQALQRVTGPLLLFFATLGLLRRQRHTPAVRWLPVAGVGVILAVLMPFVPTPFAGPAPWHEAPQALWWPVHLALVVLAASGLDDFLDAPLRKRPQTAGLLIACALLGPSGFVFDAVDHRFHLESALLLALAALFLVWRWLGILGFKTVLAAAGMVWLCAATLQEQARATREPQPIAFRPTPGRAAGHPAAPALEGAPPLRSDARARLVFDLRPGRSSLGRTPLLPRPAHAPTSVIGLPADFAPRPDAQARVLRIQDGSAHSEFRAELGQGRGALVIDETYARGWRATVDDRAVPLLRTDDGARVVLLEPGSHQVTLRYRPLAATIGPGAALLGLVIALAWLLGNVASRVFARR